jgi:hypothetical protein
MNQLMNLVEFEHVQDAINIIAVLSDRFPEQSIVLDIDDTVLYTKNRKVKQISPLNVLYRQLQSQKTKVFFVTARKFSLSNMKLTATHLKKAGYPYFEGLFLRPASMGNIATFKTFIRSWLVRKKKQKIGFIVGNTWHDLFSQKELDKFSGQLKSLLETQTYLLIGPKSCKLKLPTDYSKKAYQFPKVFSDAIK